VSTGGTGRPKKQNRSRNRDQSGSQGRKRKFTRREGSRRSGSTSWPGFDSVMPGCGCLILVLLLFVLPILWGLYDDGYLDGTDQSVESAPVFGPREAGQLVEGLHRAYAVQGVCYGWVIESGRDRRIPKVTPSYRATFEPTPNPAASPSPATSPTPGEDERRRTELDLRLLDGPGVEYGSNLGVGIDPRQRPDVCPRWMLLKAQYHYDKRGQYWSSGSFGVDHSANIDADIGIDFTYENQLGQNLGFGEGDDDIAGSRAIARLADAISGLPLLAAQEGVAPPPPPAPGAQGAPGSVPPGHEMAGQGLGRTIFFGIGIALIAGGAVWIAVAAARNLRSTSQ
jgi:hypothetical protein